MTQPFSQLGSPTPTVAAGHPRDSAAQRAGALLLLTAVATIIAVVARVVADADRPDLVQSLAAIAESPALYGAGGAARLLSGITLAVAGWFLLRTWIIRERFATPLVPALFIVSGVLTAVSGACAVVLALVAGDLAALSSPGPLGEVTAYLRWLTGKIGFTASGLALVVAARYQWNGGGALRYVAPLSVVIGIAMLFIWFDGVTFLHRISGVAFLAWLGIIGAMLLTGRVERLFAAKLELNSS